MVNPLLDNLVQMALDSYGIEYEVLECNPDFADTAAFCQQYGFSLDDSANTILVASKKVEPVKYAACVILATTKLDVNKTVCKLLGVKRASFATADETKEITSMEIGGVTIFGIENIPVYVDAAVLERDKVIMGGGNRSSKILLSPAELKKIPQVEIVQNLAQPKHI
jgi:prolyl-tRNA editing enzyme YbaK/EbsC (Cys-tRNA(Pro) deacylase)